MANDARKCLLFPVGHKSVQDVIKLWPKVWGHPVELLWLLESDVHYPSHECFPSEGARSC